MRYESVTAGDSIDEELMECPNCGSENIRVTDTNQYEVNTLNRKVRCGDCNLRAHEEFEIDQTVIEVVPDNTEDN